MLRTPATIPPEAEWIWVGDIGIESVVKFVEANGVKGGGLGGEALKYIM